MRGTWENESKTSQGSDDGEPVWRSGGELAVVMEIDRDMSLYSPQNIVTEAFSFLL